MSAACNACAALGPGCPACEMSVKPGELPTGWRPMPERPFHAAAAALVAAAERNEADALDARSKARG